MMKRNKPLVIASILTFLTAIIFTAGTFMPIPPDQIEVTKTFMAMNATAVPMPIGHAQTFAQIFLGTNLCVTLFLLNLGIGFLILSRRGDLNSAERKLLLVTSMASLSYSAVSFLCFFPIPGVLTGIAALLGIFSRPRNRV